MKLKTQPEKGKPTQDIADREWETAIKSVMHLEPDFVVVSGKTGVVTHHFQQK